MRQEVRETFDWLALQIERGPALEAVYQFLLPRYLDHLSQRASIRPAVRAVMALPEEPLPTDKPITGKIRINELARLLEIRPDIIIEMLPEFGVTSKKTHSSSIEGDVAELIRQRVLGQEGSGKEELAANGSDEYVGLDLSRPAGSGATGDHQQPGANSGREHPLVQHLAAAMATR